MRVYKNTRTSDRELVITYLTVGGSNIAPIFGHICMETDALSVKFNAFDSEETIKDPKEFRDLLKSVRYSDIVMINIHGDVSGYKKFDALKAILLDEKINTFLICGIEESIINNRCLFKGTNAEFLMLRRYIQLGGEANRRGLMSWIFKNLGNADIDVPEPVRDRAHGIYHPDFPRDVTPEEYYPSLDINKPTVGLLISQPAWLNKRLEHYDLLIKEIERQGANTIPVFHLPTPSVITGSIGAIKIAEQYFKRDGKTIIGSLLISGAFSHLTLANPTDGSRDQEKINYF